MALITCMSESGGSKSQKIENEESKSEIEHGPRHSNLQDEKNGNSEPHSHPSTSQSSQKNSSHHPRLRWAKCLFTDGLFQQIARAMQIKNSKIWFAKISWI